MDITYKVAEYIIKQGKVNYVMIMIEFNLEGSDLVGILIDLEDSGIISPIQKMESKLMATGPRLILITDLNKVKELLIEVIDPEILKGNE